MTNSLKKTYYLLKSYLILTKMCHRLFLYAKHVSKNITKNSAAKEEIKTAEEISFLQLNEEPVEITNTECNEEYIPAIGSLNVE